MAYTFPITPRLAVLSVDDQIEFLNRVYPQVVGSLSSRDALIAKGWLVDSRPPAELAREFKLSMEVLFSILVQIQAQCEALRDHRQPPHAAD